MLTIGVLALQGAFLEHEQMLQGLGVRTFEIRQQKDFFREMDGLVLPGGESTVMARLLHDTALLLPIREAIQSGLFVFGTCAGLILLAEQLESETQKILSGQEERREFPYPRLSTMKITAKRNAYGRQLGSFTTTADFAGLGAVPMTFIRAPYITQADPDVSILSVADGKITAARQANQLVTSFHPELTKSPLVHRYFLNMIRPQ